MSNEVDDIEAAVSCPPQDVAEQVGIDRFMSECRALTNLIGNGVATVAISRWEKEVSAETLQRNLNGVRDLSATTAAAVPEGQNPAP